MTTKNKTARWVFTASEIKNPQGCRADDLFIAPIDIDGPHVGLIVHRDGYVSDRYADGIVCGDKGVHQQAREADSLNRASDNEEADEWRNVLQTEDGAFVRFAASGEADVEAGEGTAETFTMKKCEECDGCGEVETGIGAYPCEDCGGSGHLRIPATDPLRRLVRILEAPGFMQQIRDAGLDDTDELGEALTAAQNAVLGKTTPAATEPGQYTPGPRAEWNYSKIGNNYDQYAIFDDTDGKSVRIATGVEGEENAAKMSAAPDMYSALEDCITEEGAHCMTDRSRGAAETCRRRLARISTIARAALSKARTGH